MRAGIDTGGYQGLPQTGTTPLVHHGVAVARHSSRVHECYDAQFSTHTGCLQSLHALTPFHTQQLHTP